jgi:nanoRNase/pAp phosphatase (c-di-AMP/oligoRNAs hydrolase)
MLSNGGNTIPRPTVEKELAQLERVVGGKEQMLIVIHNNPDPDAIMSGEALRHLVKTRYGVDTSIAYGGDVGRAENRALVRKLGIRMKQFRRIRLAKYDVVACVDTQPGAGNNLLTARSRSWWSGSTPPRCRFPATSPPASPMP